MENLLANVQRLSTDNSRILSEVSWDSIWERLRSSPFQALDILDDEATENETLMAREPQLQHTREPSNVANQHLISMAGQYEATIKQAAQSDKTVRAKWDEWSHLIAVLEGGEVRGSPGWPNWRILANRSKDSISEHVPSTSGSAGSMPASVRPLRASLEELDDRISFRAGLVSEARHISQGDDIRPEVLQEASRLAHGGSGDVKPEWFEDIFGKGMDKYEKLRREMVDEAAKQDELLERIRVSFAAIDPRAIADTWLRRRTRPSWQTGRTTPGCARGSVGCRRWTWRTGNGGRLSTTPKKGSSSTTRLRKCSATSSLRASSSCTAGASTWGRF